MRPVRTLYLTQLWGLLVGAVLGAERTRDAALHLLAKNQALEAAGLVALPGTGHADTLAGTAPAWAGALFFGLSLGLGCGTLLGLWAGTSRTLPGRWGRAAPWAALAPAAWAAAAGDPGLAAALGLVGLLAGLLGSLGRIPARRPLAGWLLLTGLVGAAFTPWALAPEGPFTRLRDRYLFASPVGLALDELYYRWTLYPAEALKPLAATSQPTAALTAPLALEADRGFCEQALPLGILCLPWGAPGADFRVEPASDGRRLELVRGAVRIPWPGAASGPASREERTARWRAFSAAADRAGPLRRATAAALFLGCPLALCALVAGLALSLTARLPAGSPRATGAAVLAGLAAVLLAGAAFPAKGSPATEDQAGANPLADLRSRLDSPRVAERFYAAHAAAQAGPAATPLLIDALSDPVINVRYAAAQSLGRTGGPAARTALLEILRSPASWYEKERAYGALWRLGWRPR